MPRAIWKGGISFGLVYIPIKLYNGASRHDIDLKIPGTSPSEEELKMAMEVIAGMRAIFQPEKYKDTYQ